jgi:hypothetical protein
VKFLWSRLVTATCRILSNCGYRKTIFKKELDKTSAHATDAKIVTQKRAGNNSEKAHGGIIYSIYGNIDLDCGVKYGLNSSETKLSLMAGIIIRF